jgi:hypothetical protein
VQDEVVPAGQEIHVHHLGALPDLGDEVPDPAPALDCRLTEIIACRFSPTAAGSMSV